MKNIFKTSLSVFAVAALPVLAFAQTTTTTKFDTLNANVGGVGNIISTASQYIVTLEFLFFFYQLAMFIIKKDDTKKAGEAKGKMGWGLLAIFVTVSLWGLMSFLGGVLGLSSTDVSNGQSMSQQGVVIPKVNIK